MIEREMAGRIMARAFHDELEKIGSLPAAVARGGGGAIGSAMRARHFAGREAGRALGIVKKEGTLPRSIMDASRSLTPKQKAPFEHALKWSDKGKGHATTLRRRLAGMPGQATPRGRQLRTDPHAAL